MNHLVLFFQIEARSRPIGSGYDIDIQAQLLVGVFLEEEVVRIIELAVHQSAKDRSAAKVRTAVAFERTETPSDLLVNSKQAVLRVVVEQCDLLVRLDGSVK